MRALTANGTSCSDSARLRAVTVISPSAAGCSCATAFCASTSATAVATIDAGRSRMFLFMFLPLLWPVFAGGVVEKSVSRLSKYRKSGQFVALRQRRRRVPKSGRWWARWDSNPGPRDSLDPAVSGGRGLSLHPQPTDRRPGCGTLVPVIKGTRKPSGSLCTFRRCTAGSAQDCHQPPMRWKVSLNSSRPPGTFQRRGTFSVER